VEQESPRKSVVAVVGPEILGSLAVLALSLVIGLAALYFIALAHRNEQRGALADFSQMLSDEQLGAMQSENVRYHFLDAASDVVAVGDRLAPGDACLQFLGGKIRELHPDFDLPAAQDTIRRFCDNRGTQAMGRSWQHVPRSRSWRAPKLTARRLRRQPLRNCSSSERSPAFRSVATYKTPSCVANWSRPF
jgi:hypothetical protein